MTGRGLGTGPDRRSRAGVLRLLRSNRPFRSLWCARGISFLGDSLSLVALMLYTANTTGQALAVALLLLVGDLAPSLLGPFTGVRARMPLTLSQRKACSVPSSLNALPIT